MSKKRKLSKPRRKPSGGIGPLPLVGPPNCREQERIEDVEEPFKVDRNDPGHQELAKHIGWGRMYEIEREEHQAWEEAKEL